MFVGFNPINQSKLRRSGTLIKCQSTNDEAASRLLSSFAYSFELRHSDFAPNPESVRGRAGLAFSTKLRFV
jgi:hypothetical protein